MLLSWPSKLPQMLTLDLLARQWVLCNCTRVEDFHQHPVVQQESRVESLDVEDLRQRSVYS
jgi:hypothetical protein